MNKDFQFQIGKAYKHKGYKTLYCLVIGCINRNFLVHVSCTKKKTKELQALQPYRVESWEMIDLKKALGVFAKLEKYLAYPPGFEVGEYYYNQATKRGMLVVDFVEHPVKGLCFVTIEGWYCQPKFFEVEEWKTIGGWRKMDETEKMEHFNPNPPF